MNPSDALFARLALQRDWISRAVHDAALGRVDGLRARGIAKTVEDVFRDDGCLDEERLRVLRRLLSSFSRQARIGDYHILRRIGIGGTGMVFEARHRRVGRRVALKVLFPRLEKSPGMADRFLREARVLARVDHPNVVHAYDAGRDGAFCFIAMEMVVGENLDEILLREGALPPARCLEIIIPVVRALAAIHGAGLLHRDVKPANILIASDGTVKLVDLGLFFADEDRQVLWGGMVFGTPRYMSPEQIRGDPGIDARSDLYSLGATWYHALAGRSPFDGDGPRDIVRGHLEESVTPVGEIRPEVPGQVDDYVLRLLSKEPEGRPPSSAEVVRTLEQSGWATSRPDRRAMWVWGGLLCLLAIAAVVGIGEIFLVDGKPGPRAVVDPGAASSARQTVAPSPAELAALGTKPIRLDVAMGRARLAKLVADFRELGDRLGVVFQRSLVGPDDLATFFRGRGGSEPILPPAITSWVAAAAGTVRDRFVERLADTTSGRPLELVLLERGVPRVRLVPVTAGADGGRAARIDGVHPVSTLIRGALADGEAALAIAYALASGRFDWARTIRDRLDAAVPPLVETFLDGLEDITATDPPEIGRRLEGVLSIVVRERAAARAHGDHRWKAAHAAWEALAVEEVLPDVFVGGRALWSDRAARARRFAWLTSGLFHTRGVMRSIESDPTLALTYPFESGRELRDFRFRPGGWTLRQGRLEMTGTLLDDPIDTVAVYRLPLVLEGSWSCGVDLDRGRLAIVLEDVGVGLGGPAGEFALFAVGSAEERLFFSGKATGHGGRFRLELTPTRVRADLPDDVHVDTASNVTLEPFGRLAIFLESGCGIDELTIIGTVDPTWLEVRIAALELDQDLDDPASGAR